MDHVPERGCIQGPRPPRDGAWVMGGRHGRALGRKRERAEEKESCVMRRGRGCALRVRLLVLPSGRRPCAVPPEVGEQSEQGARPGLGRGGVRASETSWVRPGREGDGEGDEGDGEGVGEGVCELSLKGPRQDCWPAEGWGGGGGCDEATIGWHLHFSFRFCSLSEVVRPRLPSWPASQGKAEGWAFEGTGRANHEQHETPGKESSRSDRQKLGTKKD